MVEGWTGKRVEGLKGRKGGSVKEWILVEECKRAKRWKDGREVG